ncbi:MAG TPA: lipid A biosynthesis acyltransferase [Pirellulaceae bacterium]|nr:lipid A biosynthesis acyltransferase [Pirellulaceae bacterium]
MSLVSLRHRAEYLALRVAMSLILAVSMRTCHALCRTLAWLMCDVIRLRHKLIDENLQVAFPSATASERTRLARAMWEHLLVMSCEIAHAPRKIHETNWRKFVAVHRKRELIRAFLEPRPKVVVTAHFGNFEIGGYITGFWGFPTFTVARPLDNPYLDRLVNRFRESMGQVIIPSHGSAEMADGLLSTGGTLVLVGDQHAGSKGVWVDFFGRPASCHKALALFTLLNKAPMLVTYVRRTGKPLHFEVGLADAYDPAEPGGDDLAGVTELTQWYNDVLEEEIRRSPEQYWWLHNRWREAPAGRRRKPKRRHARRAA